MNKPRFKIVVVGTSAGGLAALTRLLASLPAEFPAAVLVVQHMAADVTGDVLVRSLAKNCFLPCQHAQDGETIVARRVYIAPPDHHLLVSKTNIVVSKGARENRSRPGIDPLFRSAAVTFGPRVIGVLLTGYLDDGTAGLVAIHRCGGTCVVQDPADADYPDMPQNALNNAKIDHCLPLAKLGALLVTLVHQPVRKRVPPPTDVVLEARIAERVLSDVAAVNELGHQVPFNCPDCGGVLWKMNKGKTRYRCHTGHSFTAKVLEAEQTKKLEETLWMALRMFEERKNLLATMAQPINRRSGKSATTERLRESQVHIDRIRAILLAGTELPTDLPSLKA